LYRLNARDEIVLVEPPEVKPKKKRGRPRHEPKVRFRYRHPTGLRLELNTAATELIESTLTDGYEFHRDGGDVRMTPGGSSWLILRVNRKDGVISGMAGTLDKMGVPEGSDIPVRRDGDTVLICASEVTP